MTYEEMCKVREQVMHPTTNMSEEAKKQLRDIEDMMFDAFQRLTRPEQVRQIMLAGNAEFILRMHPPGADDPRSVVGILLEALTRGVRP